jgi:nucleotide-binding universal stress UspA family protein
MHAFGVGTCAFIIRRDKHGITWRSKMGIRDVLLTLTTYPDPAPASVIDDTVALAASLGAHVAAIACEAHVEVPGTFLSSSLFDVGALAASEARKSLKNAQALLAAFESKASKAGLSYETIQERCLTSQVAGLFQEYARLRDLAVVPVPEAYDQWYAEAIIFGAGRPTLVLPETAAKPFRLGVVLVAWDFSRAAARAVADAIPVLERAAEVRIVVVTNEKVIDTSHSSAEIAKNLARHGIEVVLDEVDARGRSIGEVLREQVAARNADLLVMGAYGHSKWREFVLGGATRNILTKPPLPVLFSH